MIEGDLGIWSEWNTGKQITASPVAVSMRSYDDRVGIFYRGPNDQLMHLYLVGDTIPRPRPRWDTYEELKFMISKIEW